MLSKNRIKNIRALSLKKFRDEQGLFVGEGPKVIAELFRTFTCTYIAATADWLQQNKEVLSESVQIDEVGEDELQKLSFLKHPQKVLGVFSLPKAVFYEPGVIAKELCLALDGVQDPGNLGTIIRLAEWFGISHLFCSHDTVDAFNPKVVQATMGALAYVKVHYVDLVNLMSSLPEGVPVFGTFMDGDNIFKEHLEQRGLLVLGNEGNGIRSQIEQKVTKRLGIPTYNASSTTVDSLNVAVATAIACSEFRRQA